SWPSFKYFEEAYCNYRLGKFSTPRKQGLDLAPLPAGTYEVRLLPSADGRRLELPGKSERPLRTEAQHGGRLFRFRCSGGRAVLDVRPGLGERPREVVFTLDRSWARGHLVHVEGGFAVRGAVMPDAAAGNYYLVLHSGDRVHALPLVAAAVKGPADPFGEAFSDYSYARFRTRQRAGADVSQLPPGVYQASVSFSAAGVVHTVSAGKTV
ncbi:hypothetical protein HER39_04360, partial [Arthrobacter deserti]|nr:hypothetical protein [Arthrobacter deserti]